MAETSLNPGNDSMNSSLEKLEALRRLSEQPFEQQELEVLLRLSTEGSETVQCFIHEFGFHTISTMVHRWHVRFRASLSPSLPGRTVLCAFTSVSDCLVDQDEIKSLLQWAAKELDLSPAELLTQAGERAELGVNSQGGDLRGEVLDLIDLIAALVYFFESPPGLKPILRNNILREQLAIFLAECPPGRVRRVLGGAAAVAADLLTELEMENIVLYTLYHSAAQAALHRQNVQRLVLNKALSSELLPANLPGLSNGPDESFEHPTSASTIFSYDAGFALDPFRAFLTDRVIFRHPPRGSTPPPWREVVVHPASGAPVSWTLPLAGEDWPWLPGFITWWVEGPRLHLAFANDAILRRIARQYQYIILSGIGPGIFDLPGDGDPVRRLVAQEIAAQLQTLAAAGARLHLEVGGSLERHHRLQPLAEAVGGGVISSMGLNDVELAQMTDMADFEIQDAPGRSEVYWRYQRALALVERLSLDRLYIHGNDADLVLRRDGSQADMQAEVQADLFAKGVVVLAVLQRSGPAWQERARHLSPVLLWRGFETLVSMAADLAAERCPDDREAHRRQFKTALDRGFWPATKPGGYAAAIVPVMWPPLPRNIHPGGAGDICSSVSLIYSGF